MPHTLPPTLDSATYIVDIGKEGGEQIREQLGSKEKFWVWPEIDGERGPWLFKRSKVYTSTGQVSGDHWSEHLASRLMRCAGVAAHETRLARDAAGGWGVICRSVLRSDDEHLVHGTELLLRRAATSGEVYHAEMNYPTDYDAGRVYATLREECGDAAARHFARVVFMDAWFGNADRHDENWGVIRGARGTSRLCPAYDNASCLGRTLLPSHMHDHLEGRRHGIAGFLHRGQSAFSDPTTGRRRSHPDTLAALRAECDCREDLVRLLDIIASMHQRTRDEVDAVLSAVGCGDVEARFVRALLDLSLDRISASIA